MRGRSKGNSRSGPCPRMGKGVRRSEDAQVSSLQGTGSPRSVAYLPPAGHAKPAWPCRRFAFYFSAPL